MSMARGCKAAGAEGALAWPRWVGANIARSVAALGRTRRARRKPVWRAPLRVWTAALVALLVIAAVMVFADAAIAEAAKHLPSWIVVTFAFLTDFGKSGWFLWPTGLLLVAIAAFASPALAPLHRLVLAAIAVRTGFLFAAIAAPSLFVTVIKRVIGRARPFVGEQADPFLYMQLVWRADYASMPSGHATTAFAAVVAVGLLWPRLRLPMLAYAVVIAVSRVVLDAHYLSDVIAGAIAGGVGALLVRDWFAARRLGFAVDADGGIHAWPGPGWARIKRVARRLIAP
jgi:membrane-associated phospholipid phosphatase